MPAWGAALFGLFGLFYTFWGYRTVRFTARVSSALLCGQVGMMACANVEHGWVSVLVGIGAGLVGFLLGNAFYFVAVALYGACGGAVIAGLVSWLASHAISWPAVIGGGAAGIFLAILIERPVVILGTSLLGSAVAAMIALRGGMVGAGVHAPDRFLPGYVALLAGLAIAGSIVQLRTTKNLPPPPSKGRPESAPPKA